jgi:hypothetical protein
VLSEVADMGGWPKCRGFDLLYRVARNLGFVLFRTKNGENTTLAIFGANTLACCHRVTLTLKSIVVDKRRDSLDF